MSKEKVDDATVCGWYRSLCPRKKLMMLLLCVVGI